jgi:hypothetical protein
LVNLSANPVSAPVGVNPLCGIPRGGHSGSVGNIANIIACALSIILVSVLIRLSYRRKAAVGSFARFQGLGFPLTLFVGRLEICALFILYVLTLALQIVTTGSIVKQGTTSLVAVTAIHAGAVAAVFWALLGNAIVATQIVEDGTLSSLFVSLHLILNSTKMAQTHVND